MPKWKENSNLRNMKASPATSLLELTNTLQPLWSKCLLGWPGGIQNRSWNHAKTEIPDGQIHHDNYKTSSLANHRRHQANFKEYANNLGAPQIHPIHHDMKVISPHGLPCLLPSHRKPHLSRSSYSLEMILDGVWLRDKIKSKVKVKTFSNIRYFLLFDLINTKLRIKIK